MSRRRRGIGARLAGWTAAVTVGALLVFGVVGVLVVSIHEQGEGDEEDPIAEAFEQVAPTLAIAAPIVLVLAYLLTRRLARRLTDRIDLVVVAAHEMTHDDLKARLPVSSAGDELDELTAALNKVFARLDEGLAAQRQFVADASHELRTPLAVLATDLEIARRRPRTSEEWEAVADRARDEVVRMTAMVDALLRLARADAGPRAGARLTGRALVESVAARWSTAAAAAQVRLDVDADDDAAIVGDADALEVAVGNLIKNAVAHSPAGGAVHVEARRDGASVALVIADQGPGVPVADRERIFQPFARGTTAADRRATDDGVGLGLSVARRIVEIHGGALEVADAPGGGARFVARLPAA